MKSIIPTLNSLFAKFSVESGEGYCSVDKTAGTPNRKTTPATEKNLKEYWLKSAEFAKKTKL